ncbi:MAG: FHA domain-containing protein [Candidatus Sumerlaeota bacterium]
MAELIVKLGDQEINRIPVTKPVLTIGRASDNDVVIENLSISRKHAELRIQNNSFVVTDLNSSNGTRVNGLPITESDVEDGDIIGVGKHNLILSAPEGLPEPGAGVDEIDMQQTIALTPSMEQAFITVRPPRQNGKVVMLEEPAARIGRAVDNDIRIIDWFIDPYQAVIEKSGMEYRFRNMPDAPPAFLNQENIDDHLLSEGDIIEIGTTQLVYTASLQAAEMAREHRLPRPVSATAAPGDEVPIISSGEQEERGEAATALQDIDGDLISAPSEIPREADADTQDIGMEAAVLGEEFQEEPINENPVELAEGDAAIEGLRGEEEEIEVGISLDTLEQEKEQVSDESPKQEEVYVNPLNSVNYPDAPDYPDQDVSDLDLSDLPEEMDVPDPQSPEITIETEEESEEIDYSAETGEIAPAVENEPSEPEPPSDLQDVVAEEPLHIEPESGLDENLVSEEEENPQVKLWKRMLDNPSEAVRKQARKQLEKLTGQWYE